MITLGIESTCDETSCALVQGYTTILSNVIFSQIDVHKNYGGVIPEIAARQHAEALLPSIIEALSRANKTLKDIDLIAAASGPGLVGPLLIGMNAAKALSVALNKPWLAVNHIEAHLFASLIEAKKPIQFPALGLVLSGGHTTLLSIPEFGSYELLGQTVDDAIGEAFDKVAKLLGWPYPGGPEIEKRARGAKEELFSLKAGHVKGSPLAFSFSGLKTAVLYTLQKQTNWSEGEKASLAAAFQETAFLDVIHKVKLAAKMTGCYRLLLGGGVTCNRRLKELFQEMAPEIEIYLPPPDLTTDNAAMLAGLAAWQFERGTPPSPLDLKPETRIPFFSREQAP